MIGVHLYQRPSFVDKASDTLKLPESGPIDEPVLDNPPATTEPSPEVQAVLAEPVTLTNSKLKGRIRNLSDNDLKVCLQLEARPVVVTLITVELTLRNLL